MEAVQTSVYRGLLNDRRRRLESALESFGRSPELVRLMGEVDDALERVEAGTFGLCETCHDAIEEDRLLADPLLRLCLDHLTPHEQRALEHDLGVASKVQGALLPPQGLRANGWEIHHRYVPLGAVSGDACGVVRAGEEGRDLFVLFGDVAGKGISASLLMTHLHATFRSLVDVGLPLQDLMQRANRLFCESVTSSHYATLVCARAGAGGELELCNAGHPPALVLRGGEVERLAAGGLPLGIFCSGGYDVERARLDPGETLVLYTDGLTEARDRSGAEFGLERLTSLLAREHALAPAALADACLREAAAFRSGAPPTDDLTLMVLRRTE